MKRIQLFLLTGVLVACSTQKAPCTYTSEPRLAKNVSSADKGAALFLSENLDDMLKEKQAASRNRIEAEQEQKNKKIPEDNTQTDSPHLEETEDVPEETWEETSVQTDEPEEPLDFEETFYPDRFGDAGLLVIPDIDINVRVFLFDYYDAAYNQYLTDNQDSACLMYFENPVIGDHKNQGFSRISECIPGKTEAYIYQSDGHYDKYRCLDVLEGHNLEDALIAENGIDYMNEKADCDLVMYTCLEHWSHIRVVLWRLV